MTDAGQITIRTHDTQSSKPNGPKARASTTTARASTTTARASTTTLGMKMVRSLTYFVVGLLILFVGWGAWSYFGSRSHVDEGDSIAELDSLEFPAPAFDSSKASKPGSSVSVQMASAKGTISERLSTSGTNDPYSVNGQGRPVAVWLTGTIEEIDRNDSLGSPRRISGGPSESTNLR